MSEHWELTDGRWTPFSLDIKKEEVLLEDTLRRLGFEDHPQLTVGEEDICDVEVHFSKCGEKFLVCVIFESNIINIFLPTFPDLLEFFKQLEPMIRLRMETGRRNEEVEREYQRNSKAKKYRCS
jgi:hypothetical protein